jgi:hypothetical protein
LALYRDNLTLSTSFMMVGPDGTNPGEIGPSHQYSYMLTSWLCSILSFDTLSSFLRDFMVIISTYCSMSPEVKRGDPGKRNREDDGVIMILCYP